MSTEEMSDPPRNAAETFFRSRPPTEMELRCAKAAYEAGGGLRWEWAIRQNSATRDDWVTRVRAVMLELRTPTEEMLFASVKNYNYAMAAIISTAVSWEKMIDAASPPEAST